MDIFISDRAKAQISKKVHNVLRTFQIHDWQSEPHNKNQNYAKCGWKDTKVLSICSLDHSGDPYSAWFLALNHMCMLLNHVTRKSLNWCTPIKWLLGFTPDIIPFLVFFGKVHYKEAEPSHGNTPDKFGCFTGVSAGVGHLVTFIFCINSGDLIHDLHCAQQDTEGPTTT
jgi:hypothetical protein